MLESCEPCGLCRCRIMRPSPKLANFLESSLVGRPLPLTFTPFTALLLLPLLWSLLQHVSEAASAVTSFSRLCFWAGTPLFRACFHGHAAAAARLLAAGADARITSSGFETPLYIAALRGHTPTVHLLLAHYRQRGYRWQVQTRDFETVLCSLISLLLAGLQLWRAWGVMRIRQSMNCMVSSTAQVQKMQNGQLSGQFRCERLAANCSTAYRGCAGPGAV